MWGMQKIEGQKDRGGKALKEVQADYHINNAGLLVFTREYHLKRGYCCGSGCVNCPYEHVAVPNQNLIVKDKKK